jgi:AcrR family transcriptional regulator
VFRMAETEKAKRVRDVARRPVGPRKRAGRRAISRAGAKGTPLIEVQKVRLLTAAAQVLTEDGYAGMSVARVTSRAGVSRRTFYDMFNDREDCFLAVFNDAITRAETIANTAYEQAQDGWRERIRGGLGALLGFFDDEPLLASLLVVDALSTGPRVLTRRAEILRSLAWTLEQGHDTPPTSTSTRKRRNPPLVAEGTVGAILSVIHARLLPAKPNDRQRPAPPLAPLLNELMGMIVLPYLGPTAAQEEFNHHAPKPPRKPHKPATDPLDALPMRLTYRTLRVLATIAEQDTQGNHPSNRRIGQLAGVHDQGQISKLLARLQNLDLIHNTTHGQPKGEPNAWTLTPKGHEIQHTIQARTGS